MLRHLHVQNYALIDQATLDFENGFTAITGETGSGKSILLGAISLLLGERADLRSIRHSGKKCVAEAQVEIQESEFGAFFQEHDLDFEPLTTIRREIAPGGKGRAFINDTPVALQVLKTLGEQLVDVHSQHENSILGDRAFQFSILDAFSGQEERVRSFTLAFREYRTLCDHVEQLRHRQAAALQNQDYLRFQLDELDQAALDSLNQQALEQELTTLEHAGEIRSALWSASEALGTEGQGTIASLQSVRQLLSKVAGHHPDLAAFTHRVESLLIESRELESELAAFAERTDSDEQRTGIVQSLLNEVYRLQQKHRVQSVDELITLRERLRSETDTADGLEDEIQRLEEEKAIRGAALSGEAHTIHAAREQAAERAEHEVHDYLSALQLPGARLRWELRRTDTIGPFGWSDVSLLFGANKGSELMPVRSVASGGEISRVMLALKGSIARHRKLPVLILDEIDQGVSGEVALSIGDILRSISGHLQVIAITHLPQIAGKADHHFKVYKTDEEDRTVTHVTALRGDERIGELAEMLGGKKRPQSSIEHARELLIRN
ncbi:MAG: DNA repair protein RecN [Flavobacteriales bacterium]